MYSILEAMTTEKSPSVRKAARDARILKEITP